MRWKHLRIRELLLTPIAVWVLLISGCGATVYLVISSVFLFYMWMICPNNYMVSSFCLLLLKCSYLENCCKIYIWRSFRRHHRAELLCVCQRAWSHFLHSPRAAHAPKNTTLVLMDDSSCHFGFYTWTFYWYGEKDLAEDIITPKICEIIE